MHGQNTELKQMVGIYRYLQAPLRYKGLNAAQNSIQILVDINSILNFASSRHDSLQNLPSSPRLNQVSTIATEARKEGNLVCVFHQYDICYCNFWEIIAVEYRGIG
jgi:hypothetical protein